MKMTLKLIGACALVGAFAATPASAEWANSLGIGQKTSNLGGAGVATASDYDVFYANPAGAANMTTTTIGIGVKVLNTTNLDNGEPGFNHGIDETVTGSEHGYLPSVGAYVPGLLPNVVIGVGFGAPFALAGNWNSDQPNPGNVTTTDSLNAAVNAATGAGPNGTNSLGFSQVEALVGELSPTIGIKLSDKLNVGVSVGFSTIKHMLLDIGVAVAAADANAIDGLNPGGAAFGGALPAVSTTLRAQTSDDLGLPIPPWEFATSPHEASVTIGAQYQLLPNVAVGAVFRSESPTEYDLNLALDLGPLGAPIGTAASGIDRSTGSIKVEIPRHVQIGATIDVTPELRLHTDVKWTNWANARGVGSDAIVSINTGGVVLGGLARQLVLANRGDDTYSLHVGADYQLLPNLQLQAGYNYDPAVFDKANLSYLMYSSDRHIFSAGASLQVPDAALLGSSGEWEFTLGGQFIHYEDITVQAGESQTFGLTPGALTVGGLLATQTVTFSPNTEAFEVGGYIWSVGASAVYKFGAPEEVYLK